MANPKDILVITASSVDGLKIKKYLKPVSAHVVAGTNLFSDFLGGLTDVFGGRSQTYQKQLTSLYTEAIDRIKIAAYEIGANCIVGLNIDMDEISGKGKSMFMLTAVGTAVIIEKEVNDNSFSKSDEDFKNVGVDRIDVLRNKKRIIEKANSGNLNLTEGIWDFITANQVDEVYPYLLKKLLTSIENEHIAPSADFGKLFTSYIDSLPEETKYDILYQSIKDEKNEKLALKLAEVIKELNLLDIQRSMELLRNEDFSIQKRALRIVTFDKPFYDRQDKEDLLKIKDYIRNNFHERGTRTTKKQLLSSKEKEIWSCECGKTNDIGEYCGGCNEDIFGFKSSELKPIVVENYLSEKVDLISEYIK